MLNKENLKSFLFLVPSLVGFLLFFILPFIFSFTYAVSNGVGMKNFVGFSNFINLFSNGSFQLAIKNTLRFIFYSVPLNILAGLLVSLLLHKKINKNKFFGTLFMSPLVIPSACIAFLFQSFFASNGLLSNILNVETSWLNTDKAFYIVIAIYIWKNMGYNLILFLAGLSNIPKDYYEWAVIEGMSDFQYFFKITLVYLTPTFFISFVMSFINSFKIFREVYILGGDYPHQSIYMLQHFMNRQFSELNLQYLSAASFIVAAVISIFITLLFYIDKKTDFES